MALSVNTNRDWPPEAERPNGPNVLHFRDKKVETLEDLQGMKIRAPSRLSNQLLDALGAVPVGMPVPQLAESLSRGVIEGALIPWEVVPATKTQELVDYHAELEGDRTMTTATMIFVSRPPCRWSASWVAPCCGCRCRGISSWCRYSRPWGLPCACPTASGVGGMAMAGVASCAGFGAICGSFLATAATMTTVVLPELRRHQYKPGLAAGSLAAGGTLGILIPFSVPLVIYAILAEQNIAKLFLAAFLPYILAALGYRVVIAIDTLNAFMAVSQLPAETAAWVQEMGFGPFTVLLTIIVIYLLLGYVMDSLSMILLTVPIFLPIIPGMDYWGLGMEEKAIWFGMVALVVMEVGLITPPVDERLHHQRHGQGHSHGHHLSGVLPFLASDIIRIMVLVMFPSISLALLWLFS